MNSQPIPSAFSERSGSIQIGAFETRNGFPVWTGERRWDTVHGEATGSWSLGRLMAVDNVLLPDGTRSSGVRKGARGTDLWCMLDEDEVWTYGSLTVTDSEIEFVLEPQPEPKVWPTGSLAHQLCANINAKELVQDEGFADELYGALTAGTWKFVGTGKEYVGTWKRAAEIVSAMRGKNEPYSDFFNSGTERFVMPEAQELLEVMGWEFDGPMESEDDLHRKAVKLVEVCEGRPAGSLPDWYVEHYASFSDEDQDLHARFNRAAFRGQVTIDDYEFFWQHVDPAV